MNGQPDKHSSNTGALEAVVERYGDLSGDTGAFARSLAQPLPPCVWAHPLRLTRDHLARLLAEENIPSESVPWSDTALRLNGGNRPGLTWLYRAGLMQTQEESAMLSVRLLDPKPGDHILDLCAAPGNKTAQIAIALDNRGTVIANDRNAGRLAPLHANLSRLGLMNVTTTAHSGLNYPAPNGSFDRVLVDVPCSGEGTIRKGLGKHRPVSNSFRHWLNGTQRGLLNRAIDLCRPGGRIVYSTCTFAPEENEAVIDHILTERARDIRIVSVEIPGLKTAPGVTRWRRAEYARDISRAIRLWPHLSNTSGFFAVLFERTGNPVKGADDLRQDRPDKSRNVSRDQFIDYFGLPQMIADRTCVIGQGNQRRLVASDHRPPVMPPAVATGLPLTRDKPKYPKLSTQAALALGSGATRNVIDLARGQVDLFMERHSMPVSASRLQDCAEAGHKIVRYEGFALGIGHLRGTENGWILESLLPKGRG